MISDAKNRPLTQSYGNLPDVSGAMATWQQAMTFIHVVKTVVNFDVVETPSKKDFQGVWQPFTTRDLLIKPEGQRDWGWFMCHSDIDLSLRPDDIIKYEGANYRVMQQNDYNKYGYFEYHLIEDYTNGLLVDDKGDNLTTESGGDLGT